MKQLLFFALVLLGSALPAEAMTFDEALKDPDPAAKYFIYIHGEELEGKDAATSSRYGAYEYDKIIKEFEAQGFRVISEKRPRVSTLQYAGSVVSKLRRLMGQGVPPVNITVAGFSRGGHIALLVASSLNDPFVNYVVLAGCGRGRHGSDYAQFLRRKRGHRLQGRILSIFDASDLEAGSCRAAFEQAGNQIQSKETQLRTGQGHGAFFTPRPAWVFPTAQWAK